MAQVSAVNNARTRGSKADARASNARNVQAGNTGNITDAPASPRKRRQAPPPPQPEDLPQQADPPARISAQAGDTPSESTRQDNILKEGWLLLKAYLLDGASASQVSDFLDKVSQPELQKVFGDIMGTEDEDVERKDALSKMIDAELERLDEGKQEPLGLSILSLRFYHTDSNIVTTETTQKAQPKKKRATTFRPNFSNVDSASRPPRHVKKGAAPKGSLSERMDSPLPPSSPAPKGPSPSPASSPTPPYNLGSKGIPTSSIPPSSPSPDAGFRNCRQPEDQSDNNSDVIPPVPVVEEHIGSTFDPEPNPTVSPVAGVVAVAKKQKHTIKSVAARRTQLLSLVQKQRANARTKMQLRLAGRKGRGLAAKLRSKGKEKKAARKGKGKAVVEKSKGRKSRKSRNVDADDTEQAALGLVDAEKRRGRLSKELREEALALRQRYHDDLEALATREGKTVSALLRAVGDVVQDNRGLNRWNAFQAYATHPEGLKMKQKKGQTEREFQEDIRAAYIRMRDGDDEEFDVAIEWYKKTVASQTTEKRLQGLSHKDLEKLAVPFINRVGHRNVCFHRFAG